MVVKNKKLSILWQTLKLTNSFHVRTISCSEHPSKLWYGKGVVDVVEKGPFCIVFVERGVWIDQTGSFIHFSNALLWTLHETEGTISLEHLRRGESHPVFLFDLVLSNSQEFSSRAPHWCRSDCYSGVVHLGKNIIRLSWRVNGPRKNETIDCRYRASHK